MMNETLKDKCAALAAVDLADKTATQTAEAEIVAAAMMWAGHEFSPELGKYFYKAGE